MKALNSILLTLVILFAGLPVSAVSAGSALDEVASREAEATRIETMLMSPCCWRQPVSDHQSDIAQEMKASIRQMLAEGKGRQEILDHYVDRYGVRILSIPPQQGFNRMSFLMPAMFGMVALLVVFLVLRNWRRSSPKASAPRRGEKSGNLTAPVDEEMSRRIEKELDNY